MKEKTEEKSYIHVQWYRADLAYQNNSDWSLENNSPNSNQNFTFATVLDSFSASVKYH